MPITFDTLAELKAFYRDFRLVEKAGKGISITGIGEGEEGEVERPRRRGRPPGKKAAQIAVKVAGKRGRKPKALQEKAASKRGPRADKGETLTSKIQKSIQGFLDANQSFTANDVYDDLSKKDSSVNKQSIITSVLKQMNSTFKHIPVTERPGNGPRPVKLYNP
jgi:hypothetical protein